LAGKLSLTSLLQNLKEFDTALLVNSIGRIDPTPSHEYYMGGSIRSLTPTLGPTVGMAVTCELDTSTPQAEGAADAYQNQLEALYEMEEPVVWVVKTVGSRPDHECVMGDGMAKDLFACGCVGVVTDGGVRDISGMLTIPFAAYARGTTIHHCSFRVRSIDKPIEIGGITVRPGDVIHANAEGVIKIPSACLNDLPATANRVRAFEAAAHAILRRSDLRPSEKRPQVSALLEKHGLER
jgi:4-hydroxy-4-methyl-2-oxoglutarate aldolase